MDAITMYETLGPIRTNGRMTVQLTAVSSREDALKFDELFQQQQRSAKAAQTDGKPQKPAKDTKETPKADSGSAGREEAPEKEDPLEQVKKLAEQGYALTQPNVAVVQLDPETGETLGEYEAGAYVVARLGDSVEVIPTDTLSGWQRQQLEQLLHNMETMARSEDPEADAVLELTDPAAEHSPAQLLEKLAGGQKGGEALGKLPREEDGEDVQMELVDAEQAPRPVFREVETAPIKVGDAPAAERSGDPSVAEQIDARLAQAMANGQSRVEIQLTPESLGTIKVEIVHGEDGTLHVALTAQNPQTRTILEKHAEGLQSLLGSRTQDHVQVQVQHQEESQRQNNNPYDGHNGQNHQQQEQQQRHSHQSSQDFLDQLRLGLIQTDSD